MATGAVNIGIQGPAHAPVHDVGQIADLRNLDLWQVGRPHDVYTRLRAEAPVYWNDENWMEDEPGFWAVMRYDDIVEVSRNTETFSSAKGGIQIVNAKATRDNPAAMVAQRSNMISMDAPQHLVYRRIAVPPFAPKALAALEPRIRGRVREILEEVAPRGTVDFAPDIAWKLPLWTLCDMMGVPEADQAEIIDWTNKLTGLADRDVVESSEEGSAIFTKMFLYGRKAMVDRRARPTDDLMSLVANTQVDGADLPREALDGFFLLMVIAGNETTRNTISGGLLALAENPDQRELLLNDRALIVNAVEEMLRYVSPVVHMRRTATRDTVLAGQRIAAGEKVVMFYPSANRDNAVFPDGQRFDIRRENAAKHLAFGIGPHFCLGARLAQIQLRIMFEELLDRFPDIAPAGEASRLRSNFFAGIKSLPVTLMPELVKA